MNPCPAVTAMEAVYESLSCPVMAMEAGCELPVPSLTTERVMGELPDCCVAPLGAVCELLTVPVMNYKCTPYLSC